MQTQVFLNVSSSDVRGYVVWMPVTSFGKWEAAAHEQAWRIPDKRITRYYDAESHLGNVYAPLLHLTGSGPAWDVYMVFGPEARWNAQPPAPSFWMHQLPARRAPAEQLLDPDRMTHAIQELLGTEKKAAELEDGQDARLRGSRVTAGFESFGSSTPRNSSPRSITL
ncbi:MAG TPA: hypothetical protein VG204_05530 [Terriglobia bacterium]|nr:hypothetical protein [Terriglobia bacterium]